MTIALRSLPRPGPLRDSEFIVDSRDRKVRGRPAPVVTIGEIEKWPAPLPGTRDLSNFAHLARKLATERFPHLTVTAEELEVLEAAVRLGVTGRYDLPLTRNGAVRRIPAALPKAAQLGRLTAELAAEREARTAAQTGDALREPAVPGWRVWVPWVLVALAICAVVALLTWPR